MKKILIIINSFHFSKPILDYAIYIAKKEKAILYGLFLQNQHEAGSEGYPFPSDIGMTETGISNETGSVEMKKVEDAVVKVFEDACIVGGINFNICIIGENYLDSLIDQSAFADLMICDAELTSTHFSLSSLLANAYCPVLLIPDDAKVFEKIIITYDGYSSSIHAMRQFAYLFTFCHHLPVHLVSVLPHNIREIEYKELVKEWINLQYSNVGIEVLKGDVKFELPRFINQHKNALVVMGSFGRSLLSRFFKESLANVVLAKTKTSLFITHI